MRKKIMKFSKVVCWIVLLLVLNFIYLSVVEALLWSQFTLMQVVFCVSWPIPYKNPMRKLFFQVGFQFNYGEPFRPSNFYNATYYQNIFNSRDINGERYASQVDGKLQFDADNDVVTEEATSESTTEWNDSRDRAESRSMGNSNDLVGTDLTAAQLYESIEDNFAEVGYDKSCLKKAICELARHPIHKEDDEEHLLLDVINFILTPTQHNGFAKYEHREREKYETAQKIGENGHDCDTIYPECENSILNKFSYLALEQ